jgi:hypothetical protein
MAVFWWILPSLMFINLLSAQQFSSSHDSKYLCLKTSQVLHINLGGSEASSCSLLNATPAGLHKSTANGQEQRGKS